MLVGKNVILRLFTEDDIDEFLTGEKRLRRWVRIEEADDTGRLRDHDLYTPAHMAIEAAASELMAAFKEGGRVRDAQWTNEEKLMLS